MRSQKSRLWRVFGLILWFLWSVVALTTPSHKSDKAVHNHGSLQKSFHAFVQQSTRPPFQDSTIPTDLVTSRAPTTATTTSAIWTSEDFVTDRAGRLKGSLGFPVKDTTMGIISHFLGSFNGALMAARHFQQLYFAVKRSKFVRDVSSKVEAHCMYVLKVVTPGAKIDTDSLAACSEHLQLEILKFLPQYMMLDPNFSPAQIANLARALTDVFSHAFLVSGSTAGAAAYADAMFYGKEAPKERSFHDSFPNHLTKICMFVV